MLRCETARYTKNICVCEREREREMMHASDQKRRTRKVSSVSKGQLKEMQREHAWC